ncbi:ABC transporter permease [Paractinoplanes lichenicola]|uniref:ABC transporter permease n=1 Tax=Paractinoplanes lichenicola TaxID=2802976 RepID=A0ABS1VN51_9ACTN|nr:ABC transporter permease [Actinoplanes lichenicola]MBL7256164.1 ABC transporter permease [Actinoplanes lichenicola]
MTRLRAAIGAEWTKLWTTRTVWWALLSALVLMAAGAGQYALYAGNGDLPASVFRDGLVPAGSIAVLALSFAQLAFLALAMLAMTSEFSTGTIRSSLTWVPARGRLLLAKCAVVAAVTFVTGVVAGLLGSLVARPLLDDLGTSAGVLTQSLKIGLYLAVLGILAVGLGAALRGPVLTLVVLLLLIVVVPPLLQVPDIAVLNAVADAMPGVAGNHFLEGDSPLVGLAIVSAWAIAAVLAGRAVLQRRDA